MRSRGNRSNLNGASAWTPVAILPNISVREAVEGEVIALTPRADTRVQTFCAAYPKFTVLLSRFTDAFGVPLNPAILMVRDDVLSELSHVEPLASFRDLLALSVIPYCRSKSVVHQNIGRISYSNSFWLYPWMLGKDNEYLVATTPAMTALHVVEQFHGQSSPELPQMQLSELDAPLFDALLRRWKRHYLGNRQRWRDRALFRSLNMAMQAAQLPAGIDTTLYDLGRTAALWVSAFEILAHPRTADSGLRSVYPLFERVSYRDRNVGRCRYCAYMGRSNQRSARRPLPCWLYGRLYQARCKFLHGSPVQASLLHPKNSKASLFWLAASLYRLALTGFLDLSFKRRVPGLNEPERPGEHIAADMEFYTFQEIAERALLRGRKT